jgi:hypothetical protein
MDDEVSTIRLFACVSKNAALIKRLPQQLEKKVISRWIHVIEKLGVARTHL